MTISPDDLRVIMRNWASGVGVVTTTHDGVSHGLTVSSFASVSLDPPHIVVSIYNETRTFPLIMGSRRFAVCLLREDQIALSNRFAGRDSEHEDRFEGYDTFTGVTGITILKDCLAYMECELVETYQSGTNTILLGRVVAGDSNDGRPLLYWNRNYRQLRDA